MSVGKIRVAILGGLLLFWLVFMGTLAVFAFATPQYGGGKIAVCHKPGTPAQKTLYVPEQAVPGHLGHGDYPGECEPLYTSPGYPDGPTSETGGTTVETSQPSTTEETGGVGGTTAGNVATTVGNSVEVPDTPGTPNNTPETSPDGPVTAPDTECGAFCKDEDYRGAPPEAPPVVVVSPGPPADVVIEVPDVEEPVNAVVPDFDGSGEVEENERGAVAVALVELSRSGDSQARSQARGEAVESAGRFVSEPERAVIAAEEAAVSNGIQLPDTGGISLFWISFGLIAGGLVLGWRVVRGAE